MALVREVRIVKQMHPMGYVCTDIFYEFVEDGAPRRAYTRLNSAVEDTPDNRKAQAEAFLRRRRA